MLAKCFLTGPWFLRIVPDFRILFNNNNNNKEHLERFTQKYQSVYKGEQQ